MKLKHSLFSELVSFSSPPKPNFLSQAGSCLFYNSRGHTTGDVFSAGGACAHPEQGQALGSASSFSQQPGTSTAPCRKATHSQLLYLELLRVSLSRQDLKCIKSNSCSELIRQQESHTDFPPHSLTATIARPLHQP